MFPTGAAPALAGGWCDLTPVNDGTQHKRKTMAARANRNTDDDLTKSGKAESAATGTLARGLAIMDLLLQARNPMTLAEIADAVGLDHSTCLRLLRNLEDLRQIIRLGQGRKYICSPRALSPLPLLHPLEQLRRECGMILNTFARDVNASVVLVIYLGNERLAVQVATGIGTLNPYYDPWLQGPLHGSGPGKAYLLSLSPAERRSLLGEEPYMAYTPQTIRTWSDLDADLQAAEARGFALVRDEFYPDLSAMSCNIRSGAGHTVGCFALTSHSRDFTPAWIEMAGRKLVNLARLLPMQVSAFSMIDTLCGR